MLVIRLAPVSQTRQLPSDNSGRVSAIFPQARAEDKARQRSIAFGVSQ
jgi:hypothetical protein